MFKIRVDQESPDFQKASQWLLSGCALQVLGMVADLPNGGMGVISPVAIAATSLGHLFVIVGG